MPRRETPIISVTLGYLAANYYTQAQSNARFVQSGGGGIPWSSITGTPSTLAGYGIASVPWSSITGTPSTLAGYGIASVPWSSITGTPTTTAGYGITAVGWALITGTPTTLAGYGITNGASVATVNWTPVDDSGGGLALSAGFATSTHIGSGPGSLVIVSAEIFYPVNASGFSATIGGIPIPVGTDGVGTVNTGNTMTPPAYALNVQADGTDLYININDPASPGACLNSQLSGATVTFTVCYLE